MAKTVKKVSFSKGLISREGSELMITEIGKDETKTYNLNKVIDELDRKSTRLNSSHIL